MADRSGPSFIARNGAELFAVGTPGARGPPQVFGSASAPSDYRVDGNYGGQYSLGNATPSAGTSTTRPAVQPQRVRSSFVRPQPSNHPASVPPSPARQDGRMKDMSKEVVEKEKKSEAQTNRQVEDNAQVSRRTKVSETESRQREKRLLEASEREKERMRQSEGLSAATSPAPNSASNDRPYWTTEAGPPHSPSASTSASPENVNPKPKSLTKLRAPLDTTKHVLVPEHILNLAQTASLGDSLVYWLGHEPRIPAKDRCDDFDRPTWAGLEGSDCSPLERFAKHERKRARALRKEAKRIRREGRMKEEDESMDVDQKGEVVSGAVKVEEHDLDQNGRAILRSVEGSDSRLVRLGDETYFLDWQRAKDEGLPEGLLDFVLA